MVASSWASSQMLLRQPPHRVHAGARHHLRQHGAVDQPFRLRIAADHRGRQQMFRHVHDANRRTRSGVISLMLRMPNSARSRWTSSLSSVSARCTPGFAAGDRRIEQRAADEDELRAERQGLDHVGAAPHAAVQHHGHAACFGRDLRQRAQRRHREVELTAGVIGDDDAIDAALARDPRIRRRDQALDHQLALPAAADQFDMLPGELVAMADVAHQVLGQHRRTALGVHVLEMRHAVIHQRARPDAEQPMRMGHGVPRDARRDRQRDLKTVADVVLAVGRAPAHRRSRRRCRSRRRRRGRPGARCATARRRGRPDTRRRDFRAARLPA